MQQYTNNLNLRVLESTLNAVRVVANEENLSLNQAGNRLLEIGLAQVRAHDGLLHAVVANKQPKHDHPETDIACAVLHRDRDGNKIPCPDRKDA